jgi:hypothetical protein
VTRIRCPCPYRCAMVMSRSLVTGLAW